MDLFYLIIGLALLVGAGDALVRGAVGLSLRFGIPAFIVSATVVAFGTSAPELLISVEAALKGAPGIALGNVVGSNIANVLLVLSVPAIVAPLAACSPDAHRNLYFMIGSTTVFSALVLTGVVPLWGGAVLLALAVAMVWDSVRQGLRAGVGDEDFAADLKQAESADAEMAKWKIARLLVIGMIGLPFGAHLLIEGARGIALSLGISESVVGLTLVAIGTSLPELATSIMAALKRQTEVAIGNVIGSNIFNLTAIIGTAAIFAPLQVPAEILARDLWVMIGASLALIPIVLLCRPIGRITGLFFLVAYVAYIYVAFV
ncbi:MAG: calcium/sodium antiporter [Pseudomonadota bacterium]